MTGMVTVCQRLASAWAVFVGKRGTVTSQAKARGRSRQTLYREARGVVAALEEDKTQARMADRARIAELEQQVADLTFRLKASEGRLQRSVEITPERQAEFASKAEAIGVSLPAARQLLTIFMKKHTPSVAQLGRYALASGKKSGELLKVLDEFARPKIKQAAGDEIFFW
jgi:hypothetical protein